jgi:ribosomal protein S18 acetylase RimI-like enzyme
LIAAAYQGHVDSLINDQYRSVAGARRFLFNIVQYPGCGTFFKPASVAAFDRLTGRICGICLASLVMPYCGHITQICVAPWVRGAGVGYELLRQSLTFAARGRLPQNQPDGHRLESGAIKLYEDVGSPPSASSSPTCGRGFQSFWRLMLDWLFSDPLPAGSQAPDFTLPKQDGKP